LTPRHSWLGGPARTPRAFIPRPARQKTGAGAVFNMALAGLEALSSVE
jgi:hypothetical protein